MWMLVVFMILLTFVVNIAAQINLFTHLKNGTY